jgi:hypothetical protein
MTTYRLRLAMALAAVLIPNLARAQHDALQSAPAQASSAELSQCLRVQPSIENIIAASTARAEAARLSNSPSELRAAADHLEAALRDIRTQLGPCATAAASTDPHAGHTMPGAPSPASTPPAARPGSSSKPAASDPHAGHAMPSTAPASKATVPAKPAPRGASKPAASDPHAGSWRI